MSTITLGYLLVVIFCFIDPLSAHKTESDNEKINSLFLKKNTIIITAVLFLCSVELKNLFLWQSPEGNTPYGNLETRTLFGHIYGLDGLFDYETDKVYYIAQGTTGYEYWIARYALTPVSINPAYTWALAYAPEEGDMFTKQATAQEWSDDLRANYTFVYLDTIDEQFCAEYGVLFENPDNISEKTIYRIDVTEQSELVTLIPAAL